MMKLSCLLLVLTVGAGMAKAGKLVYAVQLTDDVICPDGGGQCPDGSTCCRGISGQWGCCPLPQGVCCSDQLHCCPQGYSCDVAGGRCVQVSANKTMSWAKKIPAVVRSEEAASPENAICPDGLPCPGTCCKNVIGTYSCCVFSVTRCCYEGCCLGEFYGRRPTYPRSSAAEVNWSLLVQVAN